MSTQTATPSLEQQIPIGLLHPNPDQPHHLFEQNARDELAASIRQFGLLQPLVAALPAMARIRSSPATEDGARRG